MPKTRNDVDYVAHAEPWCRGECVRDDPHRHGFSCDRNCEKCKAICHPDCPAYEETKDEG